MGRGGVGSTSQLHFIPTPQKNFGNFDNVASNTLILPLILKLTEKPMLTEIPRDKIMRAREDAKKERDRLYSIFFRENSDNLKTYFKLVPKAYKWGWFKSFLGKSSKPGAIKAKCLDCSGYERGEITKCTVRTCPLWKYRPFQ
jgi:hypothetical protein